MRYLSTILLCALGVWAILRTIEDRNSVVPGSSINSSMSEDDFLALDVAKSTAEEAPAGDLSDLAVPTSSDPLASAIMKIVEGLVSNELGMGQRLELEGRLTQVMLKEGLGDETTLASASRSAVDRMIQESEKARAAGGTGALVTSFQQQAMAAISGRLAGSLRRALRESRDGKVHDGQMLSMDFDFVVPEGYAKASWEILGGFHYVEGMKLPNSVASLDGKKVGLAGYMMALGEFEDIHLFAVVESQWSCCFGTPPDIHQVVEVTIADKEDGVELVAVPILVLGSLGVGELVEDGWVISVYRMKAEAVDVLD